MRRRIVAITVAVLLASLLGGCGGSGQTQEDELLAALSSTELLSRKLDYNVDADGQPPVAVAVTIEDDYRYASELTIGKAVAYREVVYDDALAAQLINAEALPLVGESPTAKTPLTKGGWLVDELGAPPAVLPAKRVGADPIVDALAYFSYVREAAQASVVRKFDKSALDYRPDEDPFPQPKHGVVRYDIAPTRLPDRASLERAGSADVPDAADLRKLSVYVRDGQIIEVREDIDVHPFASILRRSLVARRATDAQLLAKINKLRKSIGQQPIEPRVTTMSIADRGKRLSVSLPQGTPTTLRLHVGDAVIAPSS